MTTQPVKHPGSLTPQTWRTHATAGATTYTVGSPERWTAAFLAREPAEALADEHAAGLFEWTGRTGHQIDVLDREAEAA